MKCGGNISVLFEKRLACDECGQQYKLTKVKRLKKKLEKKCVICGKKFKDTQRGVLACSKKCSIKHRKKWFKKYNKTHKKEIQKSREKYKRGKEK